MRLLCNIKLPLEGQALGVVVLLIGFSMIVSLLHRGFVLARGGRVTTAARVVDKWREGSSCYISFLARGIVHKYQVGHGVFQKLEPGQKGQLTVQGDQFIRFSTKKQPKV